MHYSSCAWISTCQPPVTTNLKWYYLNTRPIKSSTVQVVELDVIKESPNRLHVKAGPSTNYHHYLRKNIYCSTDRYRLVQMALRMLKEKLSLLQQDTQSVQSNIDQLMKEQ